MKPFRFQASPAYHLDDPALRAILARTPLPGALSITLEREPSFFGGVLDTHRHDVVAVHAPDQSVAAFGSRCERTAWLNGQAATVAYLGDLRILPLFQPSAGRILIEGYRYLHQLEKLRPSAATYTAIFENNTPARRTLVGGRAGLPQYLDVGRLHCPALLVHPWTRRPTSARFTCRAATVTDFPAITDFLNRTYRHRDLAPVHTAEDFSAGQRWPGLKAEDFLTVWEGETLVGCVAVWDLRACRQIRLQNYRGWLHYARPILSSLLLALGWQRLTPPGALVPAAFASFLATANQDVALGRLLLRHARHAAAQQGISLLFTCLHAGDPLLPALKGWLAIPTFGRLYEVSFDGQARLSVQRPPHVEAALL
jgi:hypothetical protein